MNKLSNPTLMVTVLLSAITLAVVFNSQQWAVFVPIGVIMGFIGLAKSGKLGAEPALSQARWQLVSVSVLFNLLVFVVSSLIAVRVGAPGVLGAGLVIIGFVILPFYFGMAAVLALRLIHPE